MSCNFCEEKVEAYVLGLLKEQDRTQVEEHIQSCAECRQAMEQYRKTTRLLDQAFQEKPAEWLSQKTLAKIRDRKVQPSSWLKWGAPVLAGAAAVFLLVVIQPGQIAKQTMPQPGEEMTLAGNMSEDRVPKAKKAPALDKGMLLVSQGSVSSALLAGSEAKPAKRSEFSHETTRVPSSIIAEELDIHLNNPIKDRSIYKNLGVATEVAKLLL